MAKLPSDEHRLPTLEQIMHMPKTKAELMCARFKLYPSSRDAVSLRVAICEHVFPVSYHPIPTEYLWQVTSEEFASCTDRTHLIKSPWIKDANECRFQMYFWPRGVTDSRHGHNALAVCVDPKSLKGLKLLIIEFTVVNVQGAVTRVQPWFIEPHRERTSFVLSNFSAMCRTSDKPTLKFKVRTHAYVRATDTWTGEERWCLS